MRDKRRVINVEGVTELGNWPLLCHSAPRFTKELGDTQVTGEFDGKWPFTYFFRVSPHRLLPDYKKKKRNIVVEKPGG